MSRTAKGISGELFVIADYEARGAVAASRRHIGGAGDVLAVFPEGLVELAEAKTIGKGQSPYKNFTRADREAMRQTKLPPGARRLLAVVRGSGARRTVEYIAEADWP